MHAFIGVLGMFFVLVVFPIMLIVLAIKSVRKTAVPKDKRRALIFLVIGIILFIVGIITTPNASEKSETQQIVEETQTISEEIEETNKQETDIVLKDITENIVHSIFILLGAGFVVIGVPISLVILVIKSIRKTTVPKDKRRVWIFLIGGIVLFFIGVISEPNNSKSENKNVEKISETEVFKEEKIDEEKIDEEETAEEELEDQSENEIQKINKDDGTIKKAIESIGMNYSDVKNFEEMDRWASGKRYSFVNNGFRYIVYELDNKEIKSINTGYKRTAIYEKGYEPLNYKDFEPDKSVLNELTQDCLSRLSSEYITGETSLKTVAGSMMYDRIYDNYYIYGEIKAKNIVDKERYSFAADYIVNDGTFKCQYISIDGKGVFGEERKPEIIKTEIMLEDSNSNENSIILSYNVKGNYGQYDDFDGEEYLRYYVPAGKYLVECNVGGGFYVETIELHLEDGWHTSTIISQNMLKAGEKLEVSIDEGQCISLIINTEIELNKI